MTDQAGNAFKRIIGHLCALVVAGVFIYAALGKIREPRQFAMDIKNYQMVPQRYVNLMAILMPWWEVGGALALIAPRTRRGGALVVGALLLMFIAAVSYAAIYKGLHIDCGCWGKAGATSAGWKTIGVDVALLLMTILSVNLTKSRAPGEVGPGPFMDAADMRPEACPSGG